MCCLLPLVTAAAGLRPAPGRLAAVVTIVLDALWRSLHTAYEGPTVINSCSRHSLALADFGVPPSLLLAAPVLLRYVRSS